MEINPTSVNIKYEKQNIQRIMNLYMNNMSMFNVSVYFLTISRVTLIFDIMSHSKTYIRMKKMEQKNEEILIVLLSLIAFCFRMRLM